VREQFSGAEAFFLSAAPSEWLQALFLDVKVVQYATLVTYVSWFTLPILGGLPLLLYRPERYWKLTGFLLLTYYAGMPFFALYPIEPPWLHHNDIERVIAILIPDTVGKDTNPYAAMPSLHIAVPAAAALWYGWSSGWGRMLWGYTGILTVAIVYSGDHYLADAAAGVLVAFAVYQAALLLGLPLVERRKPAAGPSATSALIERQNQLPRLTSTRPSR
jgi:hypothetical protein